MDDLERIPERQGESGTLGSLSDLLHARAVVDRWSTTSMTPLARIGTEQTRRSPVQLSLELFEDE